MLLANKTPNYQIDTKIKNLLSKRDITLNEFCEKIGITQQGYYSTFKNNSLKVETLLKICEFFKVDLHYFIPYEEIQELENKIESQQKKIELLKLENSENEENYKEIIRRNTLISYYLFSKLTNEENIKKIMKSPLLKDCFDMSQLNQMLFGIDDKPYDFENKERYAGYIYIELETFFKQHLKSEPKK